MEAPKHVTLIAGIWIVLGIAATGSGVLLALPIPGMEEMARKTSLSSSTDVPRFIAIVEGVLIRHLHAVGVGQLLLGVFMLVSGIQFRRRRAWARTSLEVMSWVGLSWFVGSALFWGLTWVAAAREGARVDEGLAMTASGAIAISVGFGYILVRMIQSLRSETIRDAVV